MLLTTHFTSRKLLPCDICGKMKRRENIDKCDHKNINKTLNTKIRCFKCDAELLKKNIKRHIHRWHTKKISIFLNMARSTIENEDSEVSIDCDGIETLAEVKKRISKVFLNSNTVSLLTSCYRYFPIKKLSCKGVEIEYISNHSSFLTYDIPLNIESSTKINSFQEKTIQEIIVKNDKSNESQVLSQIFNLSYTCILELFYVMQDIINNSSIIVYNINCNSSKKNKTIVPRKRPKYHHCENVYCINKKTFYSIWNYFKTIKQFHFKHLLNLHTLKKKDGRLSQKYIYMYINEVDRSFQQIKSALAIYTVIDADKEQFPKPFLESVFKEFENSAFSDKHVFNDLLDIKIQNENKHNLLKPVFTPSTFYPKYNKSNSTTSVYPKDDIAHTTKLICLQYLIERYDFKQDLRWSLNVGIFHMWKMQKLKNILSKKIKINPHIQDFLHYTSSLNVAKVQFKTTKRITSKSLQTFNRIGKKRKSIWTSIKKMSLTQYWGEKIKIKTFEQDHIKEKVNNKEDYQDLHYLFNTEQVEEKSKCFLPPPHKNVFDNNPNINKSNITSIFEASPSTTSCSRFNFHNVGDFMTFRQTQIRDVMAYKEQIKIESINKIHNVKKEDSWISFVKQLFIICDGFKISKKDKMEIVRNCLKNQINESLKKCDDTYLNFEHFSKINRNKCPMQGAIELERSIADIKKRENIKKSMHIEENKTFHSSKKSIDIDEKLLTDSCVNDNCLFIN